MGNSLNDTHVNSLVVSWHYPYTLSIFRTFRLYDDNRDRKLTLTEFQHGIEDYGVALTNAEVKELFNHFDQDDNGSIIFDEFLRVIRVSVYIFILNWEHT